MRTPEDHEFDRLHAKRMIPALEAGSAAAAGVALASLGPPSQFQLRSYLSDILFLDAHADMALHARSENTLSKSIMAKSEAEFEQGLAATVRLLARHTRMIPDDVEFTPAQRAFDNTYRPYRLPAMLAVVQETLLQEPSWKPDIRGIFANIGIEDYETRSQVEEYRADKAGSINTLGAAVSQWLAAEAPPSLMMRMSAVDQQYWREEGWRTDPARMPWQTPAQQMQENLLIKTIVSFMPETEDSRLAVSPEGRRAREIGAGVLGFIASRSKNNPSNS